MSEQSARDVISQVLRCAGVLLPNDYTPAWNYDRKLDGLAAEIDTALGGLTRETANRAAYPDVNVAMYSRWVSGWRMSL